MVIDWRVSEPVHRPRAPPHRGAARPPGRGRRPTSCTASTWSSQPGEVHAVMGPNGSGKSTLANTLLANPEYEVTGGRILVPGRRHHRLAHRRAGQGRHVPRLPVPAGDRRRLGHPVPAPGAVGPQGHRPVGARAAPVDHGVDEAARAWTPSFADRYLNEGFSGGEKKRNEILQMAILEPELAILDETDSGLDIDALRMVATGINEVRRPTGPSSASCSSPTTSGCSSELPPRPGAHPDRRPHRRQRRPRAGRAARARRLRGVEG